MCPLPVRTPPSGGRSCPGCPVDRACEPFPVTRAHKSLANLLPRGLFTVQRGLRLLHLGNVGLERYGMIRSRRLKAIVLGEAIYIIAAWKLVADAWTPGKGENNGAGWLIFFAILPLALILRILGVRLTGDFLLGTRFGRWLSFLFYAVVVALLSLAFSRYLSRYLSKRSER